MRTILLTSLSEDARISVSNPSISLARIPEYSQKKTSEKQKLEDIKKLDARTTLALALDENKVYLTELEQFSNLKVELDKVGKFVENIRRTIDKNALNYSL